MNFGQRGWYVLAKSLYGYCILHIFSYPSYSHILPSLLACTSLKYHCLRLPAAKKEEAAIAKAQHYLPNANDTTVSHRSDAKPVAAFKLKGSTLADKPTSGGNCNAVSKDDKGVCLADVAVARAIIRMNGDNHPTLSSSTDCMMNDKEGLTLAKLVRIDILLLTSISYLC